MVGHCPPSSLSAGCIVSLMGDWAIFCHAGSGRVGRVWSTRQKSIEILRRAWELNLGHKADRQWAIALCYHDCLFLYWQRYFLKISGLEILNRNRYSWLLLTREERWSSGNCVVILTLIIHWLGPLLSLPRCSTATLAVYSGRLAKCPDQEGNLSGSETRTCNPVIATRGFLPIELSCPCTKTLRQEESRN